ncbi:MAG: deoxyribodipyrimidine photolyase [Fimbriiglobus sp.]
MSTFNDARLRPANTAPIAKTGDYVLYWSQMYRRLSHNHALDYATHLARHLKKPLIIYEGLRLDYPWASARFHQFLLEGMAENTRTAAEIGATYWPYVETPVQPARGLLRKIAEKACLVVTDDYPQFIIPAQITALAEKSPVAVHAIDGNGLVPLALLGPPTAAAAHLRPKLHKLFTQGWEHRAEANPDFASLPKAKVQLPFTLWEPPADITGFVESLPIDQSVKPLHKLPGGRAEGLKLLRDFVKSKLRRYAEERSQPADPEVNSASGLSAHLHYGHIGIQDVTEAVLETIPGWSLAELNLKTRNKDDFFCRDANVNGFLDEAITWRDVGFQWHYQRQRTVTGGKQSTTTEAIPSFNFTTFDYSPLTSGTLETVLSPWALATLTKHASDRREYVYTLEEFEASKTHDEIWNAAQTELVKTGRIHNYLRMLWGKKVLEWTPSPEEGYRVLEHLNNKYAIDGRDPNSYTGILWCFGLFDRPWPPERQVFGNIRFMSSASTAKKFKLANYFSYIRRLPSM